MEPKKDERELNNERIIIISAAHSRAFISPSVRSITSNKLNRTSNFWNFFNQDWFFFNYFSVCLSVCIIVLFLCLFVHWGFMCVLYELKRHRWQKWEKRGKKLFELGSSFVQSVCPHYFITISLEQATFMLLTHKSPIMYNELEFFSSTVTMLCERVCSHHTYRWKNRG
jgi:hypothetical protein